MRQERERYQDLPSTFGYVCHVSRKDIHPFLFFLCNLKVDLWPVAGEGSW